MPTQKKIHTRVVFWLWTALFAGTAASPAHAEIIWMDGIQADSPRWGFSGFGIEHPIGTKVSTGEAGGAALTRVASPQGGGFALRHFARFDDGGARSQAGIWSFADPIFDRQAKSAEGVWVAQEWYFPAALSGGSWLNLWDWHSTDAGGGNRWHTSPGLMLSHDGTMRVRYEWGGSAKAINPMSSYSSISLPVNQWVDVEMHYEWSATKTATVSLWINGQLALEQRGVQTRAASHSVVETYIKFYGEGHTTPWTPTPSVKYVRNVRIGNARIWKAQP